jgi:Putative addiction module component
MCSIEQLTEEMLSLPSASRAALADKLVESLEFDADSEIQTVWMTFGMVLFNPFPEKKLWLRLGDSFSHEIWIPPRSFKLIPLFQTSGCQILAAKIEVISLPNHRLLAYVFICYPNNCKDG